MTRITSAINSAASGKSKSSADAINDLDLSTFLDLMIAELQNQDPLNPMDNKDMLAQISQIRAVGATDKLSETLDSVLLGQSIASSTNLIGADVDALSDDNQKVTGVVSRVSIENGQPKLHLDLAVKAEPSIETGELNKGQYSYRVVWQGEKGAEGFELSGDNAVSTLGGSNYKSVRLQNLPTGTGPKRIYRTDSSGGGEYRLVGTITDSSQSSFLDTTADDSRSETRQTEDFRMESKFGIRSYKVSLNNVSEIRPPGQ
jgi:flagellar basal-body rod modification protein FlgD